jgi:hypothetical protein
MDFGCGMKGFINFKILFFPDLRGGMHYVTLKLQVVNTKACKAKVKARFAEK